MNGKLSLYIINYRPSIYRFIALFRASLMEKADKSCTVFCRCVEMMADTSRKMLNAKGLREKLSAWDQKFNSNAPLSDKQKDGFMELTTLSANRPLPTEVK